MITSLAHSRTAVEAPGAHVGQAQPSAIDLKVVEGSHYPQQVSIEDRKSVDFKMRQPIVTGQD
jgi:hypothetical protein